MFVIVNQISLVIQSVESSQVYVVVFVLFSPANGTILSVRDRKIQENPSVQAVLISVTSGIRKCCYSNRKLSFTPPFKKTGNYIG